MTEFADTVKTIIERLRVHVANDPELRRSIRNLMNSFLGEETTAPTAERTHNGSHAASAPDHASPTAHVSFESAPRASFEEPAHSGPLPELTFARPPANAPRVEYEKTQAPPTDDDLTMIESRTRLKGNACRWAAERRRRLAAGAVVSVEIAPFDRDLITQAREIPGCFLWMCHLSAPEPRDVTDYETLGHGFDNLCRATSLVRRLREAGHADEADLHRSLDLLAESQSAVRAGIAALNGPIDNDQMAIFLWLRQTASDERYYIRRHMRLDDPADRFAWQDLEQRLAALDERVEEANRKGRRRSKLLGKIRHKLGVISSEPTMADAEWTAIAEVVDEMVRDGLAPSNRDLRDLLLPFAEEIPDLDPMPWGFQLVLRAIDQHLATIPASSQREQPQVQSEEVQQVSRLLSGKTIVLIGGDRRAAAEESLIDAFDLKDVYWIETREHQSIEGFEAYVARPEVSVVLLAIRWSSHSFGDVKAFCDRYGKPLVRLPSGYNPTQVATQILAQCSDRLRTTE